jgi:ribonuclease J
MELTIHRGTHEIGGTCIEISTGASRILIDFGLPLVDQNKERFEFRNIKDRSKQYMIGSGILPAIPGLYADEQPVIDGILISHPHQDHYGLLAYINPSIPIFLSRGCRELIEISRFFGQTDCRPANVRTVDAWVPFNVADFRITPYLVDHSGFDSFAFLIEAEGKRLFYSGDFRGHGRKAIVYERLIKDPPRNIDYLILEGSMIGRSEGGYRTENDIEKALQDIFRNDGFYFLACSSQNIDRLVSVYKACVKTGRLFVIDPYTACILDRLRSIAPGLPQYDWPNIRIFFAPNSYTQKLADDKSLFKFAPGKITFAEIKERKDSLVVKDNYFVRNLFLRHAEFTDAKLIFSMWEGYLPDVASFWKDRCIEILKVHGSGHAYIDELRRFVKAIRPACIVPVHTFYPELYKTIFKGYEVVQLNDRQTIAL